MNFEGHRPEFETETFTFYETRAYGHDKAVDYMGTRVVCECGFKTQPVKGDDRYAKRWSLTSWFGHAIGVFGPDEIIGLKDI